MGFIDDKISHRLGGRSFYEHKHNYKFMKIKKAKEEMMAQYPDTPIIDMGIGEPDLPADPKICDILYDESLKSENRSYADNGIVDFQVAAASYLHRIYGLENIDPYHEILHGIGAKSILSILPLCFINPGDLTLTTIPGYPILSTHTKYLGGEVYNLGLYEENHFYPDFSSIPYDILEKAKLLYLNYPNNPTGQVATVAFYEEVVSFAKENNIIVIADSTYAPIGFNDYTPLSFLSIPGAKEVGVEIHSLSKAFNMTGWRLAFIVGNAKIIEAYAAVKANIDSGQFRAIQKAGIYALNHPEITEANSTRYCRRFDLLVSSLKQIGFNIKKPKGTFYCYVPIPKGTKSGDSFVNAEEAADYLLRHAMVSTVPWDDAGAYLRFSVTFEARDYEEEKKIIDELTERLLKLELVF